MAIKLFGEMIDQPLIMKLIKINTSVGQRSTFDKLVLICCISLGGKKTVQLIRKYILTIRYLSLFYKQQQHMRTLNSDINVTLYSLFEHLLLFIFI